MTYNISNQMLELHDKDNDVFFANLSDISDIETYYDGGETKCNAKIVFKNNTWIRCIETIGVIRKKLSKLTNIA